MLKSVAILQGRVLLHKTAYTEPQLPSNPVTLRVITGTFMLNKQQSLKAVDGEDLKLRSSVKLVLEQDFRCECWALVGFFKLAQRQAYTSLSNAWHKRCFGPEKYSGLVALAEMNGEPRTPGAQMCCPPSLISWAPQRSSCLGSLKLQFHILIRMSSE